MFKTSMKQSKAAPCSCGGSMQGKACAGCGKPAGQCACGPSAKTKKK